MKTARPRQLSALAVRSFYEKYKNDLALKLVNGEEGLERLISEPTINRPGLALAGFYTYFAKRRIQVLGNSEVSYLRSLNEETRLQRFSALCDRNLPCIVVSRGTKLDAQLLEVADKAGVSVFTTTMISMKFINAATLKLEWEFAPTTTEHGCMIDVKGIGLLLKGPSGAGKSESVLGLLERGASLVADDMVQLRYVDGVLLGRSPDVGRAHMEVRGLGIINVVALFGVATVRMEKRLDVVVELKPASSLNDIDRLGVKRKTVQLLGVKIPLVELLVAPGRDLARMIEVAALDQKLRDLGYDTGEEFNQRLIDLMKKEHSRRR